MPGMKVAAMPRARHIGSDNQSMKDHIVGRYRGYVIEARHREVPDPFGRRSLTEIPGHLVGAYEDFKATGRRCRYRSSYV